MNPPQATTICEQIEHHASLRGDSVFLVDTAQSSELTYAQLLANRDEIKSHLCALGVGAQQKVAFLLDNGVWSVRLFLGVMACNRIIVPLNAAAGPEQLRYVLNHCDADFLFVSKNYLPQAREMLAAIERDITLIETSAEHGPQWQAARDNVARVGGESKSDSNSDSASGNKSDNRSDSQSKNKNKNKTEVEVAQNDTPRADDYGLLLYTSGSTGLPKGALLTHRALICGARNVVDAHQLTARDRALCVLPVYHINGAMVTVCAPLVSGGGVVMPPRFSASAFWRLIAQHHCTWASVVPTMINYLLDRFDAEPFAFGDDEKLKHFRFARSASAPLPASVLRQWQVKFRAPMIETLGLTETAGTVAANGMPPTSPKPKSVGAACTGNQIKILDEHGVECAPNVVGEIAIRGDNVLHCYYKDSRATESAFVDDWFRSGDLGLLDDDGDLFITGRLKELIVRGGENIAPREIDDVLYRHEAVLEASAVGVDDENYGQEVVACVALREGHRCTADELQAFCEKAVGTVKMPKRIYFMDELPKGPSGKILRLKLPGMIAELEGGD